MTRRKQNRLLLIVVAVLLAFISLALFAKLNDDRATLAKLYDFIKDTSLLIATIAVAYLANIYQKRQQFLQSLREQWKEIVQAKGALIQYCCKEEPSLDDYLAASRQLSECIDNMRIVYSNVGETDELIGLFPYEPLHDMRRALDRLDPRKVPSVAEEQRHLVRQEIWEAFNAIREHFLDEFDIEEPARPIIIEKMRRTKKPGSTDAARRLKNEQLSLVQAPAGSGRPKEKLEPRSMPS